MHLEARDTGRSDDRVMARPGRKLQAVTLGQFDELAGRWKPEADGASLDDDDLVVRVLVSSVPFARPVRPGTRVKARPAQTCRQVIGHEALA